MATHRTRLQVVWLYTRSRYAFIVICIDLLQELTAKEHVGRVLVRSCLVILILVFSVLSLLLLEVDLMALIDQLLFPLDIFGLRNLLLRLGNLRLES